MNLKILFIFIIGLINIDVFPLSARCSSDRCNKEDQSSIKKGNKRDLTLPKNNSLLSKSVNQFPLIKNDITLKKILENEKIELNKIFENLLLSENDLKDVEKVNSLYEIESDTQYIQNDIFYAEGNVAVLLPYGVFRADKISFDKKNKLLKAFNNLNYKRGGQYFTASYLEFDFNSEKGSIDDVYGIIDFKTIEKDLDYANYDTDFDKCSVDKINFFDLPSEVELLSSSNVRFRNSFGLDAFSFDFTSITKWRFKTDKLFLENRKWKSDLILFTNDPYNKPQFILKSKDFTAEIISGKTIFKSRSASLNFDDKFVLPIGSRTITEGSATSRWGLGYETNNKDGLYIMRSFDSINFGKGFNLDLQPYFLFQRAIAGESKAFREKGSKVISENITNKVEFLDYFAINSKLKGKIFNFNLNADTDIKTLNPEKFYDAFSTDLNLIKNIYTYSKIDEKILNKSCVEDSLKNKSINYDIDFGIYSRFNQDDIYLGYGSKLFNKYNFKNKNINKNYSLILDYGQFKGKGLKDNSEVKNLNRFGANISLEHDYKISNFNKKDINFSKEYKNISELVDQGIFINTKIAYGTYQYSNGINQNITSLSFGPTLTYGDFKRKFLDFTKLSVIPEFIIKNGESPFKFDDFNNDSRIKINLEQQIYGPIIFGLEGNYNINASSSSYGNLQNINYSLGISRRAYSINLSYQEDNKAVFLGFKIFNFGYKKSTKSF